MLASVFTADSLKGHRDVLGGNGDVYTEGDVKDFSEPLQSKPRLSAENRSWAAAPFVLHD